MNVAEIQVALYNMEFKCTWKAPNIFLYHNFESDFISVTKSGYIREFEIKLSRSDFYNDAKKTGFDYRPGTRELQTKYEYLQEGKGPTEFTYVFPKGLIPFEKIPEWAGILEVSEIIHSRYKTVYFDEIRKPKRLNKTKITEQKIKTLCMSLHYRYWDLQRTRLKEKQGQILML